MEFGTLEAIIGGVTAGLGISLPPRTVVQKHEAEGSIRLYPPPEALRQMKTEFIVRKDSFISSALRTFMDSFAPDKTASQKAVCCNWQTAF